MKNTNKEVELTQYIKKELVKIRKALKKTEDTFEMVRLGGMIEAYKNMIEHIANQNNKD